jgi:hypothetical protein
VASYLDGLLKTGYLITSEVTAAEESPRKLQLQEAETP